MSKSAHFSFVPQGLLFVALTIPLSGCAGWNWRGRGYENDEGTLARKMRPPADSSKFTGLDARAQDIERNLGVR